MTNGEMMNLRLRRIDMCDIRLALTGIICDMKTEMADPTTNEDRKMVLRGSIQKWESLKAEVVRQFDEQDMDLLEYLASSEHTKSDKVKTLKQARATGRITGDLAIDLACEYL